MKVKVNVKVKERLGKVKQRKTSTERRRFLKRKNQYGILSEITFQQFLFRTTSPNATW